MALLHKLPHAGTDEVCIPRHALRDFFRNQTQTALAISFFPVCEDDLDTSKRGRLSVI